VAQTVEKCAFYNDMDALGDNGTALKFTSEVNQFLDKLPLLCYCKFTLEVTIKEVMGWI